MVTELGKNVLDLGMSGRCGSPGLAKLVRLQIIPLPIIVSISDIAQS